MNTNKTTARKILTAMNSKTLTGREIFYKVAETLEAARSATVRTVSTLERILVVCMDDATDEGVPELTEAYYRRAMFLFAERLPVIVAECGNMVYSESFAQAVEEFAQAVEEVERSYSL